MLVLMLLLTVLLMWVVLVEWFVVAVRDVYCCFVVVVSFG